MPSRVGVGFLDVGCGHPGTDRWGDMWGRSAMHVNRVPGGAVEQELAANSLGAGILLNRAMQPWKHGGGQGMHRGRGHGGR